MVKTKGGSSLMRVATPEFEPVLAKAPSLPKPSISFTEIFLFSEKLHQMFKMTSAMTDTSVISTLPRKKVLTLT